MLLSVKNINKSFKGNKVLKDVSFEVDEGEIVAILGQSGAGKTTILRCINGLEICDGGSIEIDGEYLCEEKDGKSVYPPRQVEKKIRRKLGLVFQNFNLFPHMSVMRNITQALISVYGEGKKEAESKAINLLRLMGLEDKVNAYPFELSGGQKQRVAIARACAVSPKIMCFDEPTSALDPELRDGVASIISDLAKEKMTILIITHDMNFAKKIAQRIIFMENGEVIEMGHTDELFNNPKYERTKSFLSN
jgi:polar amino acid transport system ATP-binding protein